MRNKRIYGDNPAPSRMSKGISTRNSSNELIRADRIVLSTSTSRGMKIFVTRLEFFTMTLMAEVVPLAKKRQLITPISRYNANWSSVALNTLENTR